MILIFTDEETEAQSITKEVARSGWKCRLPGFRSRDLNDYTMVS